MMAKDWLRDLCPPAIPKLLRRLRPGPGRETIRFTGDYGSWDGASQASTGYDEQDILVRTQAAVRKVVRGEAAFERDAVAFAVMEYRLPLLAGLLRAAVGGGGRLSVLDFGGSLGSSYFQCRQFLSGTNLRWSVVEQPSHVACGREEFAGDSLRFYYTIDECLAVERPNVLLLSSVLQYLPEPYTVLDEALRHRLGTVIVDRTPFLVRDADRLTVQTVPPSIYPARYPAWFFSESRFLAAVRSNGYRLVTDFKGDDDCGPDDERAYFKGFIFELTEAAAGG